MSLERVLPDAIVRRYGLKLAIALVAVTLATAAIGAWIHVQTTQTMQSDVERELTSVSELRADEFDTWLESLRTETRATSANQAFQSSDKQQIRLHLENLVANDEVSEEVVAVHYLDTEEMVFVTSSSEEMVGVSPKEQGAPFAENPPSFEGAGDTYVTEPFRVDVVDFPVLAVISPVPARPNKAIVYMVDIGKWVESFDQFYDDGLTIVVNSQGKYVVHPNTDKVLTTHHGGADNMAVKMGLKDKSGFMDMQAKGMLMGFAPMETKSWVVMVHVPRADAYAVSSQVTTNILLLLLVGAVGLGATGLFVQRRAVKPLGRLAGRADEMAEGNLSVDLASDRRDEIGRLFNSFAEMRDSLRAEIESAEQARTQAEAAKEEAERARTEAETQREEAEASRGEAEALTDRLESKAEHYEEVMTACADGDLTRRVDPDSRSDAMTAIGEAFNAMLTELERTLATVKAFGAHVSTAATEVDAGATEVMDASEEVSGSVQEISDGAARQSDNLDDVSGEMSGLSASAEEVAATVDDVAELSERATRTSQQGREAAREAIGEMEAVERQTDRTVEEIEELEAEMETIGEIIEVITAVAEQTNLLALNASIEAARTGEGGEGFTVVADEIKRLAEETKGSVAEIEDRIRSIQDQTSQTVEGMAATSTRVSGAVETVEETIDAVEGIAEYVEDTDAAIQGINEATADQAETAQDVVEMVDEIASISEETTAEAQTVAAAAEEQTATLNEVSGSAGDLADRATDLRDILADFSVDTSDGDDSDFEFDEVSGDTAGDRTAADGDGTEAGGSPPTDGSV